MNSISLIGHLGKDPEVRGNDPENPILVFSIATTESYTSKDGQKKEETMWHNITVFGGLTKYASYLKKGSLVFVEGQLKENKYTDKDGNSKTSYYVKANKLKNLSSKNSSDSSQEQSNSQTQAPAHNQTPSYQQKTQAPVQKTQTQAPVQKVAPQTQQRQAPVQKVQPTVQAPVYEPQFTEEDFQFDNVDSSDDLPF